MNYPDTLPLSLLQPDEMVRYVCRSGHKGGIDVSIEGAAANGNSQRFEERMDIALRGLKSRGYVFGRAVKDDSYRSRVNPGRWVEIHPQVIEVAAGHPEGIGFAASQVPPTKAMVLLPELLSFGGPCLCESPAALIAATPALLAFEVEFTGIDLAAEHVPVLESALNLRSLASRGISHRLSGESSSPVEAFLALWLLHRSGWRLVLRALVHNTAPVPEVLLEMIGREFFHCQCTVSETASAVKSRCSPDLSRCYPKEWPFPPLLPTPAAFDLLAAKPFHNLRPPRLPKQGLVIGAAEGQRVRLPGSSRDRHIFILGATGTGKSTLMERMINEDIRQEGQSVIVFDVHGLARRIIESLPTHRKADLFYLDPTAETKLPGFNILDIPPSPSRFRQRKASFVVGELFRLFEELWDMRQVGGPMFEMYFRNTLLLMCLQSEGKDRSEHSNSLNLGDFSQVLTDEAFRKSLLENCTEKPVIDFWSKMAEKCRGDASLANIAPYIASKINGLVQTGFLADLLCRDRNEVRIGERMDRGEIILVNLNKGLLGAYESRLLGSILMMEIFSAGLARADRPEAERRPVNIYVDEFQNFVSDNVASMLSEARKFGLRLTLANQTLSQLSAHAGRQDLLETVLGNVGTMIAFRLGVRDAERLRLFLSPFTAAEMQELPNYQAFARILTPEGPLRPLIFRTLRPLKTHPVTPQPSPITPGRKRVSVTKPSARRKPANSRLFAVP